MKFTLIHNLGIFLLFLVLRNVITNSGQSKLEHTQKYKLIYYNLTSLLMKTEHPPTFTEQNDKFRIQKKISNHSKIKLNLIKASMPLLCQPCQ